MGISGLHTELKPFKRRVHVRSHAGKTLVADAYSWLHKGVYSCASQVAQVWLSASAACGFRLILKSRRVLTHAAARSRRA